VKNNYFSKIFFTSEIKIRQFINVFTLQIICANFFSYLDAIFRAPFGLFYHAAWFTQPHHKEGFISFLDTIVAMDDVWIITNWQAIQWIRNPTPLALLHTFEPFGCHYPVRLAINS